MGENDNTNAKFLLKNGRQIIDYIDDAGFLLGFAIGRAVQCFFKASIEPDEDKKAKLTRDGNWFINHLARRKNIVREEIVAIVMSIVGKIEQDRI